MGVSVMHEGEEFSAREFPMTQADFERIKAFTFALSGIALSDHKRNMVYGRLARRLRRIGMSSFTEYIEYLEREAGEERTEFINAITTNLTAFFRENHHFDYLRHSLLPHLLVANKNSRRLRIWSAGCSTGEEPYSIAMVLRSFVQLNQWDVKVLATDLDTQVVARAKEGVYAIERAENVPSEYRRFFCANKVRDAVQVRESVRQLVTFKPLNLLHPWPMKGPFDIIFCRNVVIYFNAETQRTLFDRYANILTTEGALFIGHSESLHNISQRFKPLGRTMYQRCE